MTSSPPAFGRFEDPDGLQQELAALFLGATQPPEDRDQGDHDGWRRPRGRRSLAGSRSPRGRAALQPAGLTQGAGWTTPRRPRRRPRIGSSLVASANARR